MLETAFTRRLGIPLPLFQAPMAGGGSTPQLVAAVSEAGGLGSLGAAYLPAATLRREAAHVRALTDRPFAINLFAPGSPPPEAPTAEVEAFLAPYLRELGLPLELDLEPPDLDWEAQVRVVLEVRPAVLSFTFGLLPAAVMAEARSRGILLVGTATTVEEARALQGVDAVVAQGFEAGGHRGSFLAPAERSLVGLMALVPQVVDAVDVPVIAAGAVMDGRGLAAALALGASAAQMGTAFLGCPEAGVPEAYKLHLREARGTELTDAYTGRHARALRNRYVEDALGRRLSALPWPLQGAATRALRSAAAAAGRTDVMAMLAGQGAPMSSGLPAADVVRRTAAEAARVLGGLAPAPS